MTKVSVSFSECYRESWSWDDPSGPCRLEARGQAFVPPHGLVLGCGHHREKMEPGPAHPLWSRAKPGERLSWGLAAGSLQGSGRGEASWEVYQSSPFQSLQWGLLLISDTELQEFLTLVKCNENFISCLSTQVKSKEGKSP